MSTGILVNNAYRRAVEWQLFFVFTFLICIHPLFVRLMQFMIKERSGLRRSAFVSGEVIIHICRIENTNLIVRKYDQMQK